MRPLRPIALLAALAVAACGPATDDTTTSGDPTPDPAPASLAGDFAVSSRFEVPATVAAPGPLGDALRLVHGLSTDPGTALLDFAEDAGVPALAELRLVLPSALEAELAGWITAALEATTVGGVAPLDRVAELDAVIRSVLLRWELRSTLSLPASGPGTHAPVALAFDTPAGPVVIPVDATAPVTAGTGVTVTVAWPEGAGGPAVATISDHAMGVPFGRYALQGLDAALLAAAGAPDVAAALSLAVGCDAVAADVAGRCVGPLCVGHEPELEAICLAGVAEAAAQLEDRVLALDFKAIHLQQGVATAVGATPAGAGATTALSGGTWTAAIDLGQGAEDATATFEASR